MVQTRVPVITLALVFCYAPATHADPFAFPEGKHDRGRLKYREGLPVLEVWGTPEEIGDAVGTLGVKPAAKVIGYPRDLLKAFGMEGLWPLFVAGGRTMTKAFPADHLAEMEAMRRASGADKEQMIVGNTLFDLKKVLLCSGVLLEAGRSKTDGPLLARNLDYPSLDYVHEYSLVTVYRPRGKRAFVSVGFPGLVGCLSGMNDAGLAVAVLEVPDVKSGLPRFNMTGTPFAVCQRRLLEECATVAEARKSLEKMERTATTNLLVADKDTVAVFEVSPGKVEQRGPERGVAACTNHYCTEALKPVKQLNIRKSFERMDTLEKLRAGERKYGPDDLRKQLDTVNLKKDTLQTMVFEPATRTLHLSIGSAPSSARKMKTLDLKALFKGD